MRLYFFVQIVDPDNLPDPGNTDNLNGILNIIFVTMGGIAVLMLVIAGIRYMLSQGDAAKVADAKRMIVYTLAGLVVIALAATIVNFVVGAF
jgi:hypothetical protein